MRLKGERGNDILVSGSGMTGDEQYSISSYNRTKKTFTVLIYSSGADGKGSIEVSIPSTIQNGKYYNNEFSKIDFRREGFANGTSYKALVETKNLSREDGSDLGARIINISESKVQDGVLKAEVKNIHKFTKIEFMFGQ